MRKIVFTLILLVSAVFIACEEHDIQPSNSVTISDSNLTDGGKDEEPSATKPKSK